MDVAILVSIVLLWVLALFNTLMTFALIRRVNVGSGKKDGLEVGSFAPDFVAETVEGKRVTLETFAGRLVAFIFISPTCVPCRESLPEYEHLRPLAAHAGVELVLVNVGEAAKTQWLIDQFDLTLTVLVAPRTSNTFMKEYKVSGTPSYCLIDTNREVLASGEPSPRYMPWDNLTTSWKRFENTPQAGVA